MSDLRTISKTVRSIEGLSGLTPETCFKIAKILAHTADMGAYRAMIGLKEVTLKEITENYGISKYELVNAIKSGSLKARQISARKSSKYKIPVQSFLDWYDMNYNPIKTEI